MTKEKIRRVSEETIIYQDFSTGDGDRYKVLKKIKEEIPSCPAPSGLSEALLALLAFSMTGILIYVSWAGAIAFTKKLEPSPATTNTIQLPRPALWD